MRFYVYTLAYPDGRVFYVGKGQGDRIDHHEKEASSGKNITNYHKIGVIRKIWAAGGEVLKEKVFETDDEQEAFYMEREYITHYGRANLTNLTDGGEGASGYTHSDETKRKISIKVRAWFDGRPEEEKQRVFERHLDREADNWLVHLRWLEQARTQYREYLKFDRYSLRRLYPTKEEEPPDFREYNEDGWEISQENCT